MHRNLILAGNFNMTNVRSFSKSGRSTSKGDGGYCDRDGKIGHFLDDEVTDLYQEINEGLTKERPPVIAEKLDVAKILTRAKKI
jgi:amidophosphoribosyltransferase